MAQTTGETYLAQLINPEVMADMISAKVDKKIKMLPYAKVDTTLQGRPGSTITLPVWTYIGEAEDVEEGGIIPTRRMGASTQEFTIKKAGIGFHVTDEAVLSGLGDPIGQGTAQIANSIAGKCDTDAREAFYECHNHIGFATDLGYDEIVKGITVFDEETPSNKILFIHPNQVADLRLDSNFISADKYNNSVIMYGEVGMVAGVRIVPSKRVKYIEGQYHDILVKTTNDAETEDDLPAITIYVKREVNVETERIPSKRETEVTADRMYVVALTNPSKVVILKVIDGASVAPLVINYNAATYPYLLDGATYSVPAAGYNFTCAAGTSPIDYTINVRGEIPLIPAATKTGLGYNEAVTNIFMANIEIKTYGETFDITKLKYSTGAAAVGAVTADDVYTYNGKTYMINCFGVYDVGNGVIANYKASAGDRNIINIEYNGVAKKYQYTYTGATLET